MKVCNILTCVLLACVVVLQVLILCTGSSSEFAQRLYTAQWKAHVHDIEVAETSTLLSLTEASKEIKSNIVVENIQQLKQRPVNDVSTKESGEEELVAKEQTEEEEHAGGTTKTMISSRWQGAKAHEVEMEKRHTFGKEFEQKQTKMNQTAESEVEGQTPELETPTAQHPQSSTDAEGLVRKQTQEKIAKSFEEDRRDGREDPFETTSNKMLQQYSHGFFWVCFPARDLERNLQKYTPVFEEFARSQKWKVNAYCWLNTRKLTPQMLYEERLCDDLEKITFGVEMEKKSAAVSDTKDALSLSREMPNGSSFDDCMDVVKRPESKALFEMKSPARFRQTFPTDQDIQVSLIKEFLNDVHYGKIRQIAPGKGDLRRL